MNRYAKFMFTLATGVFMLVAGQLEFAQAQMFYYIRNAQTGQVLDVPNASTMPGILVQQFPRNNGLNQQWQIGFNCNYPASGSANIDCPGYVTISNRNSRLVLDVPNGSTTSGTLIQQYPANGGNNQQWLLVPVGGNAFKIVNHGSSKYLDVTSPFT